MSTNKNKRLKTNQRKKRFISGIVLLISCCIVLTLLMIVKLSVNEPPYSIESRIDKVKKLQEENSDIVGWLEIPNSKMELK